MAGRALVELRGASKHYAGVPALSNVSWTLREGEIHSLLGENGAGKSTLCKIIAGVTRPSAGELIVDGEARTFHNPGDALVAGIAMVFQETNLVPSMTVAQNLFLGDERAFNKLRPLYIRAQQLMQSLNFDVDPWSTVASLGSAKRQMVEIARAVLKEARLIIFDEPTATLTPEEKGHFFALAKRLNERGVTLIFISHAIEEALAISHTVSVLRDGTLVETGPAASFDRASVIRAMVGRELGEDLYRRVGKTRGAGRKVLSVKNLSMGNFVRNSSFSIYAGQITGIFGLIGSGRTETAKIIAGAYKRNFFSGGEVALDSRGVRYASPRPAVEDGIAYVTEDRKQEGFFEQMSVAENLYVAQAARSGAIGLVRQSAMTALASTWTKRLKVRALTPSSRIIELSGGNQQKVVIAAALVKNPNVLILDEPTRGVDVGAIADIHALIRQLADEGLAIIVISSYLPEIMSLSDRILVCRMGRIVEEFSGDEATEEGIMFAAVH